MAAPAMAKPAMMWPPKDDSTAMIKGRDRGAVSSVTLVKSVSAGKNNLPSVSTSGIRM
jgi:hypothetical protein